MRTYRRIVIGSVISIAILMICVLGLHLGNQGFLSIRNFFPLLGAFIGGALVLIPVNIPFRLEEDRASWVGREWLAWILIGCGCTAWAIGECFWRYYIAHGQNTFPSLADIGYSAAPAIIFLGLILQPFAGKRTHKRLFLLLDCLIATGALLSIAWFLLLGSLAQSPVQSLLGKVLGVYYPTVDVGLLCCVTFLLLREHDRADISTPRRISLLIVGLGLSIFAASDFLFNVLENMGVYMEGTWVDLGWPLGLMTVGVAGYLRRFLSETVTSSVKDEQRHHKIREFSFGLPQVLPYLLLLLLFVVVAINVLSSDPTQQSIRPVLIIATFIVIGLLIARQIVTILDNKRLMQKQEITLEQLEQVYQDVERRNAAFQIGVTHLKEVQTRLANGDVRARVQIVDGELWPLATGLNLMADRMMRYEQNQVYIQKMVKAINDLSLAMEMRQSNMPFFLPPSCLEPLPELQRLLLSMGLKQERVTPFPEPHTSSLQSQPPMTQWRQTQWRNQ